jgi:hypothetical protein
MGLIDRFIGRAVTRSQHPEPSGSEAGLRRDDTHNEEPARSSSPAIGLVTLSGTNTISKDAITSLMTRHGQANDGYLVIDGTIQREPHNPVDPNAVAVYVEGDRIAYLPGYIANVVALSNSGSVPVAVQIFTAQLPKGLRYEAWAWLPDSAPEWSWDETHRPPLSPQEKVAAHQAGINSMVDGALQGGGVRAEGFRAGMPQGVHYLQLVEPIKQLKRDGRLEDALTLCYAAMAGAEAAAKLEKLEPAPWYTEQAAIVCRKLGRPAEERAVLERWIAACPPGRGDNSRIRERLESLPF